MKKVIFLMFSVMLLFGCRKHIDTPQQTETDILMACVNDKVWPNTVKGDTWIEGELDGKYFSFSKSPQVQTKCTLGNFLALGYLNEYARTSEWVGNGLTVFSPDTSARFSYLFQVNFQHFQGDSIAYINYFRQFEKGKVFQLVNIAEIKNTVKPETVEIVMSVFKCAQSFKIENSISSASEIDQTGSYFRISDVKEYKSASGQVYKRDVTMEFDVKLGNKGVTLSRIKNGRLFFSY